MKKFLRFLFLFLSIIIPFKKMNAQNYIWPEIKPPKAAKIPYDRIIHNDTVPDPYYWMIDFFKKGPKSDQIVTYL